ncbi:MAG: hypothetical protein ACPGQL_00010 [Thermoplasmatota archaeon]
MLALGALALPLTWYGYIVPDGLITLLGLGLLGLAVLVLFIQAVVLAGARWARAPSAARRPRASKTVASPAPASASAPAAPAPTAPAASPAASPAVPPAAPPAPAPTWSKDQDVTYSDARPAAKAAPEEMILPEAFQKGAQSAFEPPQTVPSRPFNPDDPAAWPGQRGVSDWTVQRNAHKRATERAQERRPPRDEFARKYTQTTPVVRNILTAPSGGQQQAAAPPTVQGNRPKADGKTRGQCGDCGTILLAPPQRPIKLRCPTCGRVAHLE